MKSSFITYVDESGDEGFVFNADGTGSSRWFVLSAAVIRQTNDLQMVSCLKEVRAALEKDDLSAQGSRVGLRVEVMARGLSHRESKSPRGF